MPDANLALIERFYRAFDERDGEAMAACYAPDVHFCDPVFPDLRGARAGAMWRMLTEGSKDLRVELLEHEADEARGSAHWRATYTFSRSGRPVVNDVRATFRFEGGLIVEHLDSFASTAGRGRRSGRAGCCSGGRRSCAPRCGGRRRGGWRRSKPAGRGRELISPDDPSLLRGAAVQRGRA